MSFHSWELQKAIYAKLNGNVDGLGGANIPVYDDVPQQSNYPYVQMGEETSANNGTKTLDGVEHTLTMHIWSQYRGRREIKTIMKSVYDLLHNTAISVTGASLVNVRQEFSTTLAENDGITRHGVMRFRAVVFDN